MVVHSASSDEHTKRIDMPLGHMQFVVVYTSLSPQCPCVCVLPSSLIHERRVLPTEFFASATAVSSMFQDCWACKHMRVRHTKLSYSVLVIS